MIKFCFNFFQDHMLGITWYFKLWIKPHGLFFTLRRQVYCQNVPSQRHPFVGNSDSFMRN